MFCFSASSNSKRNPDESAIDASSDPTEVHHENNDFGDSVDPKEIYKLGGSVPRSGGDVNSDADNAALEATNNKDKALTDAELTKIWIFNSKKCRCERHDHTANSRHYPSRVQCERQSVEKPGKFLLSLPALS